VNGDGLDDVIVAAPAYTNGQVNEGRVFVYNGAAAGLGTSPSWTSESNQAGAYFGWSVSGAGDVNGDGYDDVIIGATDFDNGQTDEGRAFVYYGSTSGLSSSPAWTAESNQADGEFGYSVASAGDVNGDGYDDVIIGAELFDNGHNDEGQAFVYLGSASGLGPDGTPLNADWTAQSDQAGAHFGFSVAGAGDVDGDTFDDVIVGAYHYGNDQSGEGRAYAYLGSASGLATTADWTAEGDQVDALFGVSVGTAGDVNADGYSEVIVGANGHDNGQSNEGRAYAFMGSASGLMTSPSWMAESDQASAEFGRSVAAAGDVNGDGYADVTIGAIFFVGGALDEGRAYLYEGSASGLGTSPAWTADGDQTAALFGFPVATAGDVNRDGYSDLVIGAPFFDNGQTDEGAAFLYVGVPHLVLHHDKISQTSGGFGGTLAFSDHFGEEVAQIGDVDGDGVIDLAVGAPSFAGGNQGSVWIVFLEADGSVKGEQEINDNTGGFIGPLDGDDAFGAAIATAGDLDGDGVPDLIVGAPLHDEGGADRGAIWFLYLNADGTVKDEQEISSFTGGFGGTLEDGDAFGGSIAVLGHLAGGSQLAVAVGADGDDDGDNEAGAVWILFLDSSEFVSSESKIGSNDFGETPDAGDRFGRGVVSLGDLDGSGGSAGTLAVSSSGDDSAGADAGAFWVLFLTSSGTVSSWRKITEGFGGFGGDLSAGDAFGSRMANLGPLDGIGAVNLAVSSSGDDHAGSAAGAVWILSLDSSGTVLGFEKVTEGLQNFTGDLDAGDLFGHGLASLGDLDGDGRTDLAVGAGGDDDGGGVNSNLGALWILYLNDGTLALGANATTWTGATDTQWELASNWGNGVPDPGKTAIVPDATTTPNDPAITVTGQQCLSLWIQSGGTLDISAGMDSLSAFGGATVSGPITGTGELVLATDGTLAGNDTISLTFDPAVLAAGSLELQGGPLSITGNLDGNAGVNVTALASIDVGGILTVAGDLAIDGALGVGDSLDVGGTLASSSSGGLEARGTGACIVAGQLCFHGDVTTACSLSVERATADPTTFEADSGWPASVSVDIPGTVTLQTSQLSIAGDLFLVQGTFAVGVSGSIAADSIVVEDGAVLDITGFQLLVPAPASITVQSGGKLNIGAGGELLLESNTLTIESGGTLCLDGAATNHAELSGYQSSRYTLALDSGSTLAARNFTFRQMSGSGIVIGSGVTIAAPPLDLRGGTFDLPDTNGVLLDVVRSLATQFRYLRFDNSLGAMGVTSVKTSLASSVLTLVNWSGDLAPDATTAETFDDDPGESSPPERIVFAPPEASDVQGFTAAWSVGFVRTTWITTAEVDSEAFVVRRTTEPPTVYTTVGETPSVGPGSYELRDYDYRAFEATRYRLLERLTHGAFRVIDEVVLPASGLVTGPGGGSPAPPMLSPQPIVVGDGGAYPDVRAALRALARGHREAPVTLVLASGRHDSFELGRRLGFDLCLVARPGAVIDAAQAPVRIAGLAAHRSVELVGLAVDGRGALHPALIVEDARGVVLMRDVEVHRSRSGASLQLANARAVAIQGGAIEGELLLERGSRATASGAQLRSFELVGESVLETRGMGSEEPGWSPAVPGPRWSVAVRRRVEAGSRWVEHGAAPRLVVDGEGATLEADCSGIAWLGVAPRLGFEARARPGIEGVLLLDPTRYSAAGQLRALKDGRASWSLGALPPGECVHLQGLVLDPVSGRVCLTDVVRASR
jgi:hypothetical protein